MSEATISGRLDSMSVNKRTIRLTYCQKRVLQFFFSGNSLTHEDKYVQYVGKIVPRGMGWEISRG